MTMSHVDRYHAKKTPYYLRCSPRGQLVIPKPLREYWGFNKCQFVKISATDTGILVEPVIGIIPKSQTDVEHDDEEKDPELAEAERADLNDIYNKLMR